MCKNAENPCPGCTKHTKIDPVWMFFTEEERTAAESMKTADDAADPRN